MSKYGNLISCLNEFGYVDGIDKCIEAAETIVELEKRCDELFGALVAIFANGNSLPYANWSPEQHAAYDVITKYRGVKK
jgi:hypothetical protein